MVELITLEPLRLRTSLREDELQFVPVHQDRFGTCLRADADPVDARGRFERAVRLDRHLEAARVKRVNRRFVELQQRLTAGADDEPLAVSVQRWPSRLDSLGELVGCAELPTVRTDANKVRITERADGAGAVFLASGPQVATREATE